MGYALIAGIFFTLIILVCFLTRKYIENRHTRMWFNLIAFDLLFALASLSVFYLTGVEWYVLFLLPLLNLLVIYISAWYLFTKIVFSRRKEKI